MYLYKVATVVLFAAGVALSAFNARAESTSSTTKTETRAKQKAVMRKPVSHTEIGLGYTMWNERFQATQSGQPVNGYTDFGGYHLSLERNWVKYRWQWGGGVDLGIGKASVGGLGTTLTGTNDRPWYTGSLGPFVHYRITPNFMAGVGAIIRYRAIDWTSGDSAVEVDTGSRLQYMAQFNLRWTAGRWTFIQSFAPLDFVGDTVWVWTAQYVL